MDAKGETQLLIEMREVRAEVKGLSVTMDRIYKDGFHRCATQEQRIQQLEGNNKDLREEITGIKRWVGTILVGILGFAAKAFLEWSLKY